MIAMLITLMTVLTACHHQQARYYLSDNPNGAETDTFAGYAALPVSAYLEQLLRDDIRQRHFSGLGRKPAAKPLPLVAQVGFGFAGASIQAVKLQPPVADPASEWSRFCKITNCQTSTGSRRFLLTGNLQMPADPADWRVPKLTLEGMMKARCSGLPCHGKSLDGHVNILLRPDSNLLVLQGISLISADDAHRLAGRLEIPFDAMETLYLGDAEATAYISYYGPDGTTITMDPQAAAAAAISGVHNQRIIGAAAFGSQQHDIHFRSLFQGQQQP